MLLVVLAVLTRLVRRMRPITIAFTLYEAWMRLPPEHRRRLVQTARQHAPRVASTLAGRGRQSRRR
jgi:hypothetical protein